jgi:hypothetical protein
MRSLTQSALDNAASYLASLYFPIPQGNSEGKADVKYGEFIFFEDLIDRDNLDRHTYLRNSNI